MPTYKCHRCGIIKPLTEFHRSRQHLSGHDDTCKECDNQRCRQRYAQYKDAYKKKARAWRQMNRKRHYELTKRAGRLQKIGIYKYGKRTRHYPDQQVTVEQVMGDIIQQINQ